MKQSSSNSMSRWLAVIVVLQVVTLVGQWIAPPTATTVQAQIPDAGAQRLEMIEQLKGTNERLDKLLVLIGSGKVQVQVVKPDDSKDR